MDFVILVYYSEGYFCLIICFYRNILQTVVRGYEIKYSRLFLNRILFACQIYLSLQICYNFTKAYGIVLTVIISIFLKHVFKFTVYCASSFTIYFRKNYLFYLRKSAKFSHSFNLLNKLVHKLNSNWLGLGFNSSRKG